jgi:hypothetical protein
MIEEGQISENKFSDRRCQNEVFMERRRFEKLKSLVNKRKEDKFVASPIKKTTITLLPFVIANEAAVSING